MASAWDTDASDVQAEMEGYFSTVAVYAPFPSFSPTKSISVVPSSTPPQMIIGDDSGQTSERYLYIGVNVSDVPSPRRGDLYTLSDPSNKGVWIAARIEKQNNARWLIAARLRKHDNTAGPGAVAVSA